MIGEGNFGIRSRLGGMDRGGVQVGTHAGQKSVEGGEQIRSHSEAVRIYHVPGGQYYEQTRIITK